MTFLPRAKESGVMIERSGDAETDLVTLRSPPRSSAIARSMRRIIR
jgi:hypothetical protein